MAKVTQTRSTGRERTLVDLSGALPHVYNPAPTMRASSPSRALGLWAAIAVALPAGPSFARVASPAPATDDPPPREPPADPTDAPPPAPISTEAAQTGKEPPPPSTPTLGKPLQDAPRAGAPSQPAMVAPANNVSPMSPTAGMGGRLVSSTDPEARRAKAELEGTSLDKTPNADVPKRLPPMQRRAWWLMFGAFAVGSAGGVMAGLAEVQEDKATRLAITLDSSTGAALVYADIKDEYEHTLRVGRRDAAAARGLVAAASGFLVAGVVLFIVHAVKARKAAEPTKPASPRLGLARGGLELRF